jgi:hypothetical protein
MAWMALVSSRIWWRCAAAPRSAASCWTVCQVVVGQRSALPVRKAHADHHEGPQEYGFQRHHHGEQSERVGLDQEADPGDKPDDVDIDASAVKPNAVFQQEVAREQWLA